MKKIFHWIKEHVKPTMSYNKDEQDNTQMKWKDKIKDAKKRISIGIKIGFKF